jgi:histidinol-phosphatase (PHP family)
LFDAIGHIDGVKRHSRIVTPADLAAAPSGEPVLHALVESGCALEVNTSGLRYSIGEAFPHPAIVARFRELGGRAVTVGSDAHRAAHFAWGLADGYAIVAEAGFGELTFRRAAGALPVAVSIPFHGESAGR